MQVLNLAVQMIVQINSQDGIVQTEVQEQSQSVSLNVEINFLYPLKKDVMMEIQMMKMAAVLLVKKKLDMNVKTLSCRNQIVTHFVEMGTSRVQKPVTIKENYQEMAVQIYV